MDKEILLDWYQQMTLIRKFEQRSAQLYQLGKIGGFLHLYIGQEAVAVGSITARQPQDHLITAYRDHAHALLAGTSPNQVMAELMGKASGISKGRGGSMHLADRANNYWGGYGIVGGHLPLGVGIALAEQYRGTDSVTLCYFGDGSTNIGYFHESLNLAGIWDLPVLFICENNQYGMGTSIERAMSAPDMVTRGAAYGMPAKSIDGMDVIAVHQASKEALTAIRAGNGPQFLEMKTYRFEGHSMGDPLRYRTKEELNKWREDDPIGILEKQLIDQHQVEHTLLDEIDQSVEKTVEEAVDFAEQSPFPPLDSLMEGIYVAK